MQSLLDISRNRFYLQIEIINSPGRAGQRLMKGSLIFLNQRIEFGTQFSQMLDSLADILAELRGYNFADRAADFFRSSPMDMNSVPSWSKLIGGSESITSPL